MQQNTKALKHGWDERSHAHIRKSERNSQIYLDYRLGDSISKLARDHKMSRTRVRQIIEAKRGSRGTYVHAKDVGIAICDGLDSINSIEVFDWDCQVGRLKTEIQPLSFEYDDGFRDKIIIKVSDGSIFKVVIVRAA